MRIPPTLRRLIGPLELIHEQAGPALLRVARLGIFFLWIVKILLDPLWRLSALPRALFAPIGILRLLPPAWMEALLTPVGLTCLWLALLAGLGLCLSDRAFAFVSTLTALLLTVYSSLVRGFGPAVHTDIVLLLSVYALAGFAWADRFQSRNSADKSSLKSSQEWSSFPLLTIVALLCLSYCLVGINRSISGGPKVFAGDTMEIWTVDASLRGYFFNTNIGWQIPDWPWVVLMLRLGLPVITCFEITAPLCLIFPHFRWIFIPTMLSFHLLSLVLMNIFFFDDMFLYLLLIDWSRAFPVLRPQAIRRKK